MKLYSLILAGIMSCLLVMNSSVQAQLVNRIVAVVNGEIITLHDLNQEITTNTFSKEKSLEEGNSKQQDPLKREFLESMINDILLVNEAQRLQMQVSDVEVENRIQQIIKRQDVSQEQLEKILKKQNMSMDDFKKQIRENILKKRLLNSMVTQKVVVTNEEIRQYYNEHSNIYEEPKSFHLKLMALGDRERLRQVRNEIRTDKLSFQEALQQCSLDSESGLSGDLGFLAWKDLKQGWKEAVKNLQPGDVSHIFQIKDQYGFLYLDAVRSEEKKSLEEAQKQIRQVIRSEKLERQFQEYMQRLRSKAVIDVRL